jgi:PAS domain S-box-containing protein
MRKATVLLGSLAKGETGMKGRSNLRLVFFFVVLTIVTTWVVILSWERVLRRPFYRWVEVHYPDQPTTQYNIQQRVEHFFISTTVDIIVVTLLLRLVDRQQTRIRRTEQRYRAIFEHATDGMAITTTDHRILDANPKFGELVGCSPDNFISKRLREVVKVVPEGESSGLDLLLNGAILGELDLTLETAGGKQSPVSVTSGFVFMDDEKLILTIMRDRSERSRLECDKEIMQRQLFQTSKLASIGELSAGVAHEINNPLNCIINLAQLLKDDAASLDATSLKMVNSIIDEGSRITKIVRNLLTFARCDLAETRPINLAETITNSMSLFGRQLEMDGVKVEIDLDPNLPAVMGDAAKLRQVIVNMISNARRALREKDSDDKLVRISAWAADTKGNPRVTIEFYDNGVGIRAEDMDKVFDPFFTTRRDSGGTGLGLSITFGIIHEYGGTVIVNSEEGKHTVFTVEIPSVGEIHA